MQETHNIIMGVLLAGVIIAGYFLPTIVLWIGSFSPILAVIVGVCLLMCFFGIFWLRARYQRSRKP